MLLEPPDSLLFVYDDPSNAAGALRVVVRIDFALKARGTDGKRTTVLTNVVRSGRRVLKQDLLRAGGEVIDGTL